jgi:hypothetical protein
MSYVTRNDSPTAVQYGSATTGTTTDATIVITTPNLNISGAVR